jgi:hypothetical protein
MSARLTGNRIGIEGITGVFRHVFDLITIKQFMVT